jgi:hypothetical protein
MFGYLVGIPDLAEGEYVTDVDLDQCALCQAGRDEQAEPISRNINYLDRPTVKHERSQAAQETVIRGPKALVRALIGTAVAPFQGDDLSHKSRGRGQPSLALRALQHVSFEGINLSRAQTAQDIELQVIILNVVGGDWIFRVHCFRLLLKNAGYQVRFCACFASAPSMPQLPPRPSRK